MKKIVVLLLVLAFAVFVSGCINQTAIKSQEEASQAVQDVSEDIEKVGSSLEDVESGLG
ncbi:MAG: hypothetical protein ACE5J7_00855 [Candidatus Aenigmatarchaeota archaeon]